MYRKFSYLLIIVAAAALAFSSCGDTLDDVYAELDNDPTAVSPMKKDVEYTLTAADYATISAAALTAAGTDKTNQDLAKAVATTNSLNSFANALDFVPALLKAKYKGYAYQSSAQVTYNYVEDYPAYLAELASGTACALTNDDYKLIWGGDSEITYFTPTKTPAANLPTVLAAKYPSATTGDVALVTYKMGEDQADAPSPIRLQEDFEGYTPVSAAPYTQWDQNGWTGVITEGTKQADIRKYNSNNYAQFGISFNPAEDSEFYKISPLVDLSQTTANEFSFDICVGYWNYDGFKILIATAPADITDPAKVAWDDVTANFTIPQVPTDKYGVFGPAGTMNLDAKYAGKKIYIAFKYNGTYIASKHVDNKSTTYQVDNILIKGEAPAGSGEVAEPWDVNVVYTYNGSKWVAYSSDTFILQPDDYKAMNLSSLNAAQAASILPRYLANNLPYALEGTKKAVVYKSSATAYAADEFIFSNNVWQTSHLPAETTDQFLVSSSKDWVLDPNVTLTMEKSDYQVLVTAVLKGNDPALRVYTRGTYENEEWYFGTSAYYGNFNFRLSGSTSSSRDVPSSVANDTELHSLGSAEAKVALLWTRMETKGMPLFLQSRYPKAKVVPGIDAIFTISANVYYPDGITNRTDVYTFTYKLLTTGSPTTPPTFEYLDTVKVE